MRTRLILGTAALAIVGVLGVLYLYQARTVEIAVERAPETAEKKRTENKVVRLGLLSWPGDAPVYIGDEKGFFSAEGITLEIQLIESYDARRTALISGQIDIDANTLDQLLIYAESGVHAQVFGMSDFSTGGDGIIASKDVVKAKDLVNKSIAYAEASPSEFFLRYYLDLQEINFAQIRSKPVADAQVAGTAVLAQTVDAAVTYEPWLTQSSDNPELHLLVTTREFPNLIPGLFIARAQDLQDRPEVFRRFMKGWYTSVEYFRDNPEESKLIMSRRMGLELAELESVLHTITILGREENLQAYSRSSKRNLYELMSKIEKYWREQGFVSREFDQSTLIRNDIVE